MPARAWLGGIFRREVAAVEARIVEVGADPVTDRRIGLAFHPVRVELARTREQLAERGAVTAGQRVELVVPTGVRSRLTQVLDPVRRNIDPAVRRWLKELLAS
jgi:hypothetical protein